MRSAVSLILCAPSASVYLHTIDSWIDLFRTAAARVAHLFRLSAHLELCCRNAMLDVCCASRYLTGFAGVRGHAALESVRSDVGSICVETAPRVPDNGRWLASSLRVP